MIALTANTMVDLHNHLLPGLDDGSPDLETSVQMARMAADDGLTHMVCTPHASHQFHFDPPAIADRLAALTEALTREGIMLTLATGCDFHLSYDNLLDALANPRKYTLNNTEYLLIELPDHGIPATLDNTLYELRLAGMTPILTHPERNLTLQRNQQMLAGWLRNGLLVQITANSVTGGMGKPAQRIAHELLRKRWVHFLATDAHNLTSRPPRLSEAHVEVSRKYGSGYADLLCTGNATAVFAGQALPPQEEMLGLYDDDENAGIDGPWWKRLFRASR